MKKVCHFISYMALNETSYLEYTVLFDEVVFREESVQRVYQYLRRRMARQSLDSFHLKYDCNKPEGRENECLDCIIKYVLSI